MSGDDRNPASDAESAGDASQKWFPTVGIGSSAGGVRALQEFFENLPDHVNAAFVVVVHLDPAHQSELPNILAARTRMPVVQVTGRIPLEPGRVYVIPPNRQLIVANQHLLVAEFDEPRWRRTPIDLFFRSLGAQQGDDFAIVLSGAGSDGAVGIKAVKEAGGVILVQDPGQAEYSSMPHSAVATGVADFVLPVREIAQRLPELIRVRGVLSRELPERFRNRGHAENPVASARADRPRLHQLQESRPSVAASPAACRCSAWRRWPTISTVLRENAAELQALFADLLISVTTFFRDPAAFDKLATIVVPRLFEDKGAGDAMRAWVPGCATGEEAYSVAILLLEEAARHDDPLRDPGVRLRSRRGRAAGRPRGPLSARDRSRHDRRAPQAFLRPRERPLSGHAGAARRRVVRQAQPPQGSAVLARRPHLVPQPADLPRPPAAAAGLRHLPLRPEADRLSLPGIVRERRQSDRHVPRRRPRGAHLSAHAGRVRDEGAAADRAAPTSARSRCRRDPAPIRAADHAGAHREALERLAPPSAVVDESYRVLHLSETSRALSAAFRRDAGQRHHGAGARGIAVRPARRAASGLRAQ